MGVSAVVDAGALAAAAAGSSGLLLGIASSPPCVLSLLPTPAAPEGVSAAAWVEQHARYVARMLPGGVRVLGTYDLAGDTADAAAAALRAPLALRADPAGLAAPSGPARVEKIAQTVRLVRTRAKVMLAVRCSDEAVPTLPEGALRSVVSALRIEDVVVLREDDTRLLRDVAPTSEGPLCVEALRKLGGWGGEKDDGPRKFACIDGFVESVAVVRDTATLGEVLQAVREDVIRSCNVRLDLLRECAEDDEDEAADDDVAEDATDVNDDVSEDSCDGPPPPRIPFPARVLAMPVRGNDSRNCIPFCDYVCTEDESIEEEVVPRMSELLSWASQDVEMYEIIQFEALSSAARDSRLDKGKTEPGSSKMLLDGRGGVLEAPSSDQQGRNSLGCGLAAVVAVAVVGVAIQYVRLGS